MAKGGDDAGCMLRIGDSEMTSASVLGSRSELPMGSEKWCTSAVLNESRAVLVVGSGTLWVLSSSTAMGWRLSDFLRKDEMEGSLTASVADGSSRVCTEEATVSSQETPSCPHASCSRRVCRRQRTMHCGTSCLRLQAQTAGRGKQRQGKTVCMVLVESVALEVELQSPACEERAVENQWQNRGQEGRWWEVYRGTNAMMKVISVMKLDAMMVMMIAMMT